MSLRHLSGNEVGPPEKNQEVAVGRGFLPDLAKYLPSHLIPSLIGLVSVPVITSLFLPEDYGNYNLVIVTVSILTTLSGWAVMSVQRFHPLCKEKGTLPELRSSILFALSATLLIVGLTVALGIVLAAPLLDESIKNLMLVGIVLFVLSAVFAVLQSFLRARRRAGWYSAFSVMDSTARLAIGVLLVAGFGLGVEGLLWGAVLAFALTLPLLWTLAMKNEAGPGRVSFPLIRNMLTYSLPLVAGNLAAWVLNLSDRYVLKAFRGAAEVGLYSAGYAISEKSISLIAALFMLAAGPIGFQVWEREGGAKASAFVSTVTRYYLLISIPAVVGLSVLARPVIEILTSHEYHQSYYITPFIAISGFLLGLQQRYHLGIQFKKKTKVIMYSIVIAGLINLALNLIFVPKYGYVAASITTLVGYIVLFLVVSIGSLRCMKWAFPFAALARSLIASAIMAAVVFPLGTALTDSTAVNLAIAIPVGMLAYLTSLLALGELRPDEKGALLRVVSRLFRRRS
jgi:O-antigen/teichoic acid export membrane protein